MGFATWTATPYDDLTSTDTPRRRGLTEFYVTDTRDINYEQRKRKMEEAYEKLEQRLDKFNPDLSIQEQIKIKTKLNDFNIVKDIVSRNVCRRMMNSRR